MRTTFLALIVLNLVFFGWNYYHPPESSFREPPPLDRHVKVLALLSESGEGSGRIETAELSVDDDVGSDDSTSESMLTVDDKEVCYSLGPFKKPRDTARVMTHIEARGLSATRRSTTQRVETGHWVYLPPLANRKFAQKIAKNLAKAGIEDYFVIASGENKNAISLGLYSSAAAAKRRIDRIKALGYEPVREVKYKDQTLYWLDYQEIGENTLPSEFWELLAHSEDKLQRLKVDCPVSTDLVSVTAQ